MKKLTLLMLLLSIVLFIHSPSIKAASNIVEDRKKAIQKTHDTFDISKKSVFDQDTKTNNQSFKQWKTEIETTITLLDAKASSLPFKSASLSNAAKLCRFILSKIEPVVRFKNKDLIPLLKADLQELNKMKQTIGSDVTFYASDKKLGKRIFLEVLEPELRDTIQNILQVKSASSEQSPATPTAATPSVSPAPTGAKPPILPPKRPPLSKKPITQNVVSPAPVATPTVARPPIAPPRRPPLSTTPITRNVVSPAPVATPPVAPPVSTTPITPPAPTAPAAPLAPPVPTAPPAPTAPTTKPSMLIAPSPAPAPIAAPQQQESALLEDIKNRPVLRTASEQKPLLAPNPEKRTLLTEIKKGRTLKKVEPTKKQPAVQEELDPFKKAMSGAMSRIQERRPAVAGKEEEEEEEEEEDWD